MVDATSAPSGLQINPLDKGNVGGTSVDEIHINQGTIVVPTTPTPPADKIEIEIDPGMAAPLATPTAPGLEVNSMNSFTTDHSQCYIRVNVNYFQGLVDNTPEPSHANTSSCIIDEGHTTVTPTDLTGLTPAMTSEFQVSNFKYIINFVTEMTPFNVVTQAASSYSSEI